MLKQALANLINAITSLVYAALLVAIGVVLGFLICLVFVIGSYGAGVKKSSKSVMPKTYQVMEVLSGK